MRNRRLRSVHTLIAVAIIGILLVGCPPGNGGGGGEGEGEPAGGCGDCLTQTITLPGGVELEMISLPSGTFIMGSTHGDSDETPVHEVTISQSFQMSQTEVTIGQYLAFLRSTGDESGVDWDDPDCPITRSSGIYSLRSNTFGQNEDQPMVEISWNGAVAFAAWVGEQTGETFRLPTEAEWEYACRAGSTTEYSFGESSSNLGDYAWYSSNSGGATHTVGQKLPNAFGLYDMHGNVWEWCEDWYDSGYYASSPSTDPPGPGSGSDRVRRGGGWSSLAAGYRSANRAGSSPSSTRHTLGFRLAR